MVLKTMVYFFQSMFPNSVLSKNTMGNNSFTLASELIYLCLLWALILYLCLLISFLLRLLTIWQEKMAGALVHYQMVTRFEIGSCVRTADVPGYSNLDTWDKVVRLQLNSFLMTNSHFTSIFRSHISDLIVHETLKYPPKVEKMC